MKKDTSIINIVTSINKLKASVTAIISEQGHRSLMQKIEQNYVENCDLMSKKEESSHFCKFLNGD